MSTWTAARAQAIKQAAVHQQDQRKWAMHCAAAIGAKAPALWTAFQQALTKDVNGLNNDLNEVGQSNLLELVDGPQRLCVAKRVYPARRVEIDRNPLTHELSCVLYETHVGGTLTEVLWQLEYATSNDGVVWFQLSGRLVEPTEVAKLIVDWCSTP